MNKEELIAAISERSDLSKVDVKRALEAYIEVTTEELKEGGTIQLIGFASIGVTDRAERKGRNPQTGKEITIAASKAVKFTAGKALKDAINNAKAPKKAKSDKAAKPTKKK
jgi:DNA-binding protein HU-beta